MRLKDIREDKDITQSALTDYLQKQKSTACNPFYFQSIVSTRMVSVLPDLPGKVNETTVVTFY